MSLIDLRNLYKRFGPLVVLNGVNLQIDAGKCLVVLGASGSGKSVLLKHIVGLLRPDQGEVWFDGQRIDQLPERKLMQVRQRFGFLFQMGALFDSLTVEDNVAFPLVEHTHKSAEEVHQVAQQKLALVGLPDAGKKMPGELSGGQRKRVALARAIALTPDVINELILKLKRELNVTSIVVTHDMQSAFKVGDRIVMLHEGHLIFDGTPDDIRKTEHPIVRRFIAGEASEQELAMLNQGTAESVPI